MRPVAVYSANNCKACSEAADSSVEFLACSEQYANYISRAAPAFSAQDAMLLASAWWIIAVAASCILIGMGLFFLITMNKEA